MPWQTPTLPELRKLNRDSVTARLGSSAMVPNSVLRILADSNAGLGFLTLRYIDWLSKQFLPDTAEEEWLRRHAQIWLGGWKQATFAAGSVAMTGDAGSIIPVATRLTAVGGLQFETTAQRTMGPQATSVPIVALQTGSSSNIEAGVPLSLAEAVSGIDGNAVVETLLGGTEEETDDELRARVLERIRQPPMGGAAHDYVAWAKSVPGVTRAWCSPLEMGIGTVTVRFMLDDLRAAHGGFPQAEDIDAMTAYLETVRPVTVKDLFVVAPVPFLVDVQIQGLTPDTASIRAGIDVALAEMLIDRAAPAYAHNGVTQPAQTIFASWISEAIQHVEGVEHFRIEMEDVVMPNAGAIAVLGSVTYV